MQRGDKSRHVSGHKYRKQNYNRKMRRLAKKSCEDAPIKLPGFAVPGFCCGYHPSDWRY